MRTTTLPLRTFGFIVATRAALGAGLGVLFANRLSSRQRSVVGITLAGLGAVTTIPAAYWLSRSMHRHRDPRLIGSRRLSRRVTTGPDLGNIPREFWMSELDRFSRQHEEWLVSLTTKTPDGKRWIEAHDVPLEGVSVASRTADDLVVSLGTPQRHLTHEIRSVVAVRIELTEDRAERALVVEAKDGSTTSLEFRSPKRTEEVDGLPAPAPR